MLLNAKKGALDWTIRVLHGYEIIYIYIKSSVTDHPRILKNYIFIMKNSLFQKHSGLNPFVKVTSSSIFRLLSHHQG